MNIDFTQKYIYWITFFTALLLFLLIFWKKRNFLSYLINNNEKLTFGSGIILSMIGVSYIINNIVNRFYIQLLLGDLCMMLGVIAGPIFLSRNARLIKTISPWMFVGGLFTIMLSHPPFKEEGLSTGIISYLKHIVLVFTGLISILINKYDKKDLMYVYLFTIIYAIWILLTSGIALIVTKEEKWGVWSTALLEPSYREIKFNSGGKNVIANSYDVMGASGIPYPIPSLIFYLLVFSLIFFVINFSRKLHKKRVNCM